MPTQVVSNAGNDLASRYSYLLQPIRDLTKNWDIDVAAQLEEYLAEIEKIQISFDGGKTSMNFAEAALLIQGSACVYSRKVEYLYTLVYQTLDLIASKKRLQQAVSVDDQGQDKDITFQEEEDFLCLDDIKEAKNIDLKEHDILGEAPLIPRTPLALIPLGEKERQDFLLSKTGEVLGSRNDFKMNTCTVHSSGALLLDLAHLSLLDSSFNRLPTSTPQPSDTAVNKINEPRLELPQEEPAANDLPTPDISMANDDNYDDYDNGGDGLVDQNEDLEDKEHKDNCQDEESGRMQLRQRDRQQAAAVVPKVLAKDPWELLDPHVSNAVSEKPFRKGRPFRIPPSILATIKETRKKRKRTEEKPPQHILTPIHEFCATAFHSHASKFPKNPLKAPTFKEFEYLFWIEHRRRQALDKKQKKILTQYLTQEQYDDLTEVDPEFREDNEPPQQEEAPYGGPEGGDDYGYDDDDGFGGPTDDVNEADAGPVHPMALEEPSEGLVVSSYEDLVRRYVEGYLLEAQQYAQETDLSRRVRCWENNIVPALQEEEAHGPFDIHKYGETVLGTIKGEKKVPFSEIMNSKKPWEICRYFLATLQLANNYNVEIGADGLAEKGVDTMTLKLLHKTPVHAGIASFRAPSVVT